ncbi:hypothetical protein TNCV_2363881 [Trichonephila clavipes]|nr:hypothetical protein TNCV_2363881 [Trichonephila clavipes]
MVTPTVMSNEAAIYRILTEVAVHWRGIVSILTKGSLSRVEKTPHVYPFKISDDAENVKLPDILKRVPECAEIEENDVEQWYQKYIEQDSIVRMQKLLLVYHS